MAKASVEKQSSNECHKTLVMISQHWFRLWLDAVRQQAITWANVDSDLCRHIASLGHNELIWIETRIYAIEPQRSTNLSKLINSMNMIKFREQCSLDKKLFTQVFGHASNLSEFRKAIHTLTCLDFFLTHWPPGDAVGLKNNLQTHFMD